MNNQGWISVNRKIIDWEWYKNANTSRIFIHLLLMVNHEDGRWQGIDIKRGQTVTSPKAISEKLNISIQGVRTSINKLKSTGELTIKTTNKYSLITVNKYNEFQDTNKQTNKQLTNNQQTTNKQLTTNNNDNNKNNENKREHIKEINFQEIADKLNVSLEKTKDTYERILDFEKSDGKKYKDYPATIRNWIRRDKDKIPTKVVTPFKEWTPPVD